MEKLKSININSVNQLVVIGEILLVNTKYLELRILDNNFHKLTSNKFSKACRNCYKVKADIFVEQATTKFKDLGDHGTPFQKKQFEALSRTIVDYDCDSNTNKTKGVLRLPLKQKKKKQKAKEKLEQQEKEKSATELELLEDKLRKLQDEINKEKTRAAAELELLKQKFAVDKRQADAEIRQLKDDVKKKEDQEAALKNKFAVDKEQADAQISQLKDDVKKKEDQEAALENKFTLQNQDEIKFY
ncbi:unnamed protein product [Arabis nemorensis]|uniref:Uncharacterized protein n=1 Tax=Arabis nemorensis TaxID=586526 RepID=A0A565CE40_9BRAS|nr:unnamed protein product [Arabis nemorensis]